MTIYYSYYYYFLVDYDLKWYLAYAFQAIPIVHHMNFPDVILTSEDGELSGVGVVKLYTERKKAGKSMRLKTQNISSRLTKLQWHQPQQIIQTSRWLGASQGGICSGSPPTCCRNPTWVLRLVWSRKVPRWRSWTWSWAANVKEGPFSPSLLTHPATVKEKPMLYSSFSRLSWWAKYKVVTSHQH